MARKAKQGENTMNSKTGWARVWLVLGVGALGIAFAVSMSAQVKTETTTTHGQAVHEVTVEHGEVVLVEGNDLMVKMQDGTIRHFANVPDSARATVDGQKLGIHDLKPGMNLQRTLTVITTPKTVTTVQTVTGKVWHINPPHSVILTLEDGTNQSFKIPDGQKFTVDGQETDAWGLKKGMKVSATKIVEVPEIEAEHQQHVTGSMPPPPLPPPANQPILIASAAPEPTLAAQAPAAPAELPKTGSLLPLIGLLGSLALFCSFGLRAIRRTF
jgi:hypothetical protein